MDDSEGLIGQLKYFLTGRVQWTSFACSITDGTLVFGSSSAPCNALSDTTIDKKKTDIILYPNPVQEVVTLANLENIAHISLLATDGRLMWQYHVNPQESSVQISVADLESGIYIVRIADMYGNLIGYEKLVKQ